MSDEPLEPMVFIREDCFYIVDIPRSQVAANAQLNPGTIRVEDAFGATLWEVTKQ